VRYKLTILPQVHPPLAGKPGAMQGLIRHSGSLLDTILMQIGCSKFLQKPVLAFIK
jgi:hypothetical protein